MAHGTNICKVHRTIQGGCKCPDRGRYLHEKPCRGGDCATYPRSARFEHGRVVVYPTLPKVVER